MKNLQYELWPAKKWVWHQKYDLDEIQKADFWRRTFVNNGHLIWSGSYNGKGLPTFYHKILRSNVSARRVAWTLFFGPVDMRYDVVPACDDSRCISFRCIRLRLRTPQEKLRWQSIEQPS